MAVAVALVGVLMLAVVACSDDESDKSSPTTGSKRHHHRRELEQPVNAPSGRWPRRGVRW